MNFKPSKYQQDIFDFVEFGQGNAVINAVAGSSKTTIIVESLKLIPNNQKVLFIAFNKVIVDELSNKINRNNVDIKTLHSLGLLIIKNHFKNKNVIINEYKYKNYINENINTLAGDYIYQQLLLYPTTLQCYKNNIIKLCDLSRQYLAQTINAINEIAIDFDINYIANENEVIIKILDWAYDNVHDIDFTDMIYLPNALNMLIPHYLKYDFIMIDEVQDTNIGQIELFQKCFKRGARFIAVGDKKQQIYRFCGADDKAFEKLQNIPNTKTLPLSICYRCPQVIINKVQSIVPEIEARDNAPYGNIKYDVLLKDIKDGDMILCRNISPLLEAYNIFINNGQKAHIKGSDIGINMIEKIKNTNKLLLNNNLKNDGVFVQLYKEVILSRNQLMQIKNISVDDAIFDSRIMGQLEMINAMNVLSNNLVTTEELISRINEVFDQNKEGIILSTIHKAKGLEADNVYILSPELIPSILAEKEWELQQEENLRYVAYTRAKQILGFIKNDQINNQSYISKEKSTLNQNNKYNKNNKSDYINNFKNIEYIISKLLSIDLNQLIIDKVIIKKEEIKDTIIKKENNILNIKQIIIKK
jgi:superfamily I DNA/RNA helicase